MKKFSVTLAVILAVVITVAIMTPAFAAKANDFDCLIVSPKASDVGVSWAGEGDATFEQLNFSGSPTVAEDGSAKFIGNIHAGAYIYIYPSSEKYNHATSETYPYVCASVKITGADDDLYFVFGEGDADDRPVGELTEYTKIIDKLPTGVGLDITLLPDGIVQSNASRRLIKVVDYSPGATLSGVIVYIEYIGFFKTKADAQAFDYNAWLEDNVNNEPETSEPEASESESSAPESSTSTPESSTSTPESSASAPESSASAPENSTSDSESSASDPYISAFAPETSSPQNDQSGSGSPAMWIVIAAVAVVAFIAVVAAIAAVVIAIVVLKKKKM